MYEVPPVDGIAVSGNQAVIDNSLFSIFGKELVGMGADVSGTSDN